MMSITLYFFGILLSHPHPTNLGFFTGYLMCITDYNSIQNKQELTAGFGIGADGVNHLYDYPLRSFEEVATRTASTNLQIMAMTFFRL